MDARNDPGNVPPAELRPIRDLSGLVAADLVIPDTTALEPVAERYAILVPTAFRTLIEHPDDPIARQVVPHPDEASMAPHEHADPIGDERFSPVPGIVHRYPDRALLKPLLVCPVYCRFCFRREKVGPDGGLLDEAALQRALDWIRETDGVREVILTGGDPLLLSPRRLEHILRELDGMAHVSTVRIHSRVPVADPGRIDDALLEALEAFERAQWLVLHTNHPRELTTDARRAVKRLLRAGLPVLGQSVLLRGVNDDADTLEALLRAMVEARIKPYYLHQLDPAPGTARFHVPIAEGRRLLRELRGRVTGLAWPTYVLDIPGGHGKVPIGPEYLDADGGVHDPSGTRHVLAPVLAPEAGGV